MQTTYLDNPSIKVKNERDFLLKIIMEKQSNIPEFPIHLQEFMFYEKKIIELSEQNKLLCMFFENKGEEYYENCFLLNHGSMKKFRSFNEAVRWKQV